MKKKLAEQTHRTAKLPVLAIDPGTTDSAYVLWDGHNILEKGKIPSEEVLPLITRLAGKCEMVCEMIASYGMGVGAEVFETCIWIGRYLERAEGRMSRVVRGKVKMHLCKSMKATDSNIRTALIDMIGPPGKKKAPGPTYGVTKDIWAALALAVTYMDQRDGVLRL